MGNQYKLDHALPTPGNVYGRWTVLELRDRRYGHRMVLVRCACGTEKELSWPNLRRGLTVSCGCYHSEATARRNYKPVYFDKAWVPDDGTRGWAAGFFDGEGSTVLTKAKNRTNARVQLVVSQASSTGEVSELLVRFRDAVAGLGSITGPYWKHSTPKNFPQSTMPIYRFSAYGLERVQTILGILWPWLGIAKKEQAIKVLRELHGWEV